MRHPARRGSFATRSTTAASRAPLRPPLPGRDARARGIRPRDLDQLAAKELKITPVGLQNGRRTETARREILWSTARVPSSWFLF
jgi:methylphosphotriester-DNA--protein-cysteine methyltransferase